MRVLSNLLEAAAGGFLGFFILTGFGIFRLVLWGVTLALSLVMVGYFALAVFCIVGFLIFHLHSKLSLGVEFLVCSALAFPAIVEMHFIVGETGDKIRRAFHGHDRPKAKNT